MGICIFFPAPSCNRFSATFIRDGWSMMPDLYFVKALLIPSHFFTFLYFSSERNLSAIFTNSSKLASLIRTPSRDLPLNFSRPASISAIMAFVVPFEKLKLVNGDPDINQMKSDLPILSCSVF